MDFEDAQREIDKIQMMLKEARESGAPGATGSAVFELERIMFRKVGELEAAKTEARDAHAMSFESILFAPDENEEAEESTFSSIYAAHSR